MCEFIMDYTKPNGLAPQVGDADDGRLHILSKYGIEEKRDHRHILSVAGEYFDRDDFRSSAGTEVGDALWIFSNFKRETISKPVTKDVFIKSYPEIGYHVIRDSSVYIGMRCGPVGQAGSGGHSHNDQLSLELHINGYDVFVDAGTYVYTRAYKMRNHFRSTGMHNTVTVNNEEQNPIYEKDLFRLLDRTKSQVREFSKSKDIVSLIGEHYGYLDRFGVIHRRQIVYSYHEKKITIIDSMSQPANCVANWLISNELEGHAETNSTVRIGENLKVSFDGLAVELTDVNISPSYGTKLTTKKIKVRFKQVLTTTIEF